MNLDFAVGISNARFYVTVEAMIIASILEDAKYVKRDEVKLETAECAKLFTKPINHLRPRH